MYDIIIVGAGIAGAVCARQLAEQGKQILLLDKREHIGGNCYDAQDDYGVLIHPYGPHIFHTNNQEVFDYLSRFTKWTPFTHKVVANVHGTYMPIPFNLNTLKQAFPTKHEVIKEKLLGQYKAGAKVPILELQEAADMDLRELGQYVYNNVYVYYTMKQWGKRPEEIDPSVTARVPVNISYEDGYFSDTYQGLPQDGFTQMFANMVEHERITIKLSTEAGEVLSVKGNQIFYEGTPFHGEVIFTGPLDEWMDCKYGRLPYRTLNFTFEHYDTESYQGYPVVNYTVDEAFTRITEYKLLTRQSCAGTTICKEYPESYTGKDGQIPYYAIANAENEALYERYKEEAARVKGFHLLGRLAEYRYYNIDKMVEKALQLCEAL